MKKLFSILALCSLLSACATMGENSTDTATVNYTRGKNVSRITDAELKQYNKQRANEVTEQASKSTKTRMQIQDAREGIQAAREGVSALREIISIFR